MNIFKKLFSKLKKRKKQDNLPQEEAWYNNSHEGGMAGAGSMEGVGPTSANWLDFATTNWISQK